LFFAKAQRKKNQSQIPKCPPSGNNNLVDEITSIGQAKTHQRIFSLNRENHIPGIVLGVICASTFWSIALMELFAASLLVLWVFSTVGSWTAEQNNAHHEHRNNSGHCIVMIFWGVYTLGVIVSIFLSPERESSIGYLSKHWHALLFPAVFSIKDLWGNLRYTASLFLASATVAAVAGMIRFGYEGLAYLEPPIIGVTTYAYLLVIAAIIALNNLLRGGHHNTSLTISVMLCIVFAIFYTTLKSAVIALFVGGLVLVAIVKPKFVPMWIALIGLTLLLSPHVLISKFQWILSGNPTDRYTLWERGLTLLKDVPLFGLGPNSFPHIISSITGPAFVNKPPVTWHNDFLQTILESGWLTGAAYIGMISMLFWLVIRLSIGTRTSEEKVQNTLLGTLMAIFIFFSMVSSVVSTAALGVVWWLLLGVIAHVTDKGNAHNVKPSEHLTDHPQGNAR